jgi:hypothetical protein
LGTKSELAESTKQNASSKAAEHPEGEAIPASEGDALKAAIKLDSLQYHINIVLPESRDQAVYDAIFKSLRDHLR